MKLQHYNSEKFKEDIKNIMIDINLPADYRVFVFGSRVSENCTKRSDIDLGISGKKKIDTLLKNKIESKLNDLPILYKLDFVDFFDVSKNFKKKALKNVEYII